MSSFSLGCRPMGPGPPSEETLAVCFSRTLEAMKLRDRGGIFRYNWLTLVDSDRVPALTGIQGRVPVASMGTLETVSRNREDLTPATPPHPC